MSRQVDLAEKPFDPAELLSRFTRALEGEGAVVSFTGHARNRAKEGSHVEVLVLESYRGVTLASMEAIAADATARFAITRCRVVRRAGRIEPGETIVFVATASPHRRAAFEAADYLMDRLKTEAVFWKHEDGPDGRHWVEPTEDDEFDAACWRGRG
ncbi:MAG: molybdenum cofactor biosynthesis protein MoaE [Sphingomonadales bacterium]|nr:MAG: molybdenum cofactor biosynthesis protein MoaE [Sphingomonadales bacterium]